MIELTGASFSLCPHRLDGSALEACSEYGLDGSPTRVASRH